ncbi:MAG: hypothetical protein JW892_08875 [Anaerolineae bacterium]|nr:hypothetical protein [Anaerolineae bacterium]
MDHTRVLKRAWEILKQYRVLWVFGLILALTTASASSGGAQSGYQFSGDDFPPESQYEIPEGSTPQEVIEGIVRELSGGVWQPRAGTVITIIVLLVLVILVLGVIAVVARYVSEAAMIRMVDIYETNGEKLRFREGWRLGWSREAWRLFLIDLAIFIPVFVGAALLLGLAALPLLLLASGDGVGAVIGVVTFIGLLFLVIFVLIIVTTLLSLLVRFFRRVCVLEKVGVGEALRRGFAMVKQNWKDVGIMWLIMIGISIGFSIVMAPIMFLFVAGGALIGGGVGLLLHGLAGLLIGDAGAWIIAGLIGIPIFILVIIVPASLLSGMKEVYVSSAWTLTYRELQVLGRLEPEPLYVEA